MTTSLKLGAVDLHREPIEVLIEKINALNTLQLNPADFTLGPPVAEAGVDYDTKISLIPTVGSVWINSKWAYYTRVTLESVMRVPTRVVTAGNALLYDILDAVNTAYGIYLQEADVEQATIEYVTPADPNGPGTVTITARPTSVFYKGEFTIPVNTQASQGLNTYDDEAVYYVLAQEAGLDTIKAFNIRGEAVDGFVAFKGATFEVSSVHHFEMLNNGDLMVIGDFVYTTTNGFGETTQHTKKLIKLNPTGEIIDSAAGNVFGANYPDISRLFDKTDGAAYVIDPLNSIGGRVSLVHRFAADGTYDNTFHLAVNSPVSHIAVHGAYIYAVTSNEGVITISKHSKTTGVVDATFTPIVLSGQSPLQLFCIGVDEEGIKVVVDFTEASRTASQPLMFNGAPLWTPGPASSEWFRCLNFTLTGAVKPATVHWRAGITPEFSGSVNELRAVFALSAGWMVLPTYSHHPYYGTQNVMLISAAPNGEMVRSPGNDPKQIPRWFDIQAIQHVENGDIAVCGRSWVVDDNLEIVQGTQLALYNRLGEVSTTLVTSSATDVVFKKVFGRVP